MELIKSINKLFLKDDGAFKVGLLKDDREHFNVVLENLSLLFKANLEFNECFWAPS